MRRLSFANTGAIKKESDRPDAGRQNGFRRLLDRLTLTTTLARYRGHVGGMRELPIGGRSSTELRVASTGMRVGRMRVPPRSNISGGPGV
jgi:hypothetical protein